MKYLNGIMVLFVIFLVGCAPVDQAPAEGGEAASPGEVAPAGEAVELAPIKIGVIGPMVGDNAGLGEDLTAAVNLAVQEINSEGGVNGHMLEAIFENGGCTGKDATTAATKLIDVDNVEVIVGGYCSSETLAAAPLAEAAQVALVSPASSNPSITDAGDFVFRITPSDVGQAEVIAKEVIESGHTTAGVIYLNMDYSVALADAFKANFEALGGTVSAFEVYEQDSKDFRTQVAKVRAARPDAIYIASLPPDGALVVKQIKQLKMEQPLFGGEAFGSPDLVEAAGKENAEGIVYATPAFDEERPAAKEFLPKVQQIRGGDLTLPVFAANSYDAVYLIAAAGKGSPSQDLTGSIVRDYLYTVADYDGAGGVLTIDENGDAVKEFSVMYIHEGDFHPAP